MAWLRVFGAFLPCFGLIVAAMWVELAHNETHRLERVAEKARISAAATDLLLGKALEVTEFCATSPDLIDRMDLKAAVENCGRYAALIGGWMVVVELGDIHRHLVNTRAGSDDVLPIYPREQERPELLELEAQSRITGCPVLSNVFRGLIHTPGIVAAGQFVRLADGRDAMAYVGLPVSGLSRQLKELASGGEQTLALVDPSGRIVARSSAIEQAIFSDIPPWFEPSFKAGGKGAVLAVSGPEVIGGIWDAGYHPLERAPGWMAIAVQPVSAGVQGWRLVSLPSAMVLTGVFLSALMFWLIAQHDRNTARIAATERARAFAEQQNRDKSRLLASFAHEIRSPLISLVGSLELIEKPRSERLQTALGSAEMLLQLVDDILELAFLGSGKFTLHPSPVDLRQLARILVDQARSFAGQKRLELHLDLDPKLPPVVEVDRLRLQQVLSNLLTNAVKYTQSGTVSLRISVTESKARAVTLAFAVTDTGVGLAPADIPHILLEYGRLDRAVERREAGTGLGLAIVQRVLGAMGSVLTIDSTPGKGSTFGFSATLPVLADRSLTQAAQSLEGVTILYVEDEPIIRQVTAGRLGATGARVVEAVDGVDALDQLARLTPDLLLVDLQMPVLDGLGLIRHLRAETPRLRYPLFVLTSHIGGPQAAEAKAAGADVILTKPVQIEPLAAALRAWRGDNGLHTEPINRKGPNKTSADVDAENLRSVFGMLKPDAAVALLEKYEASMRREFATIERVAQEGDAAAIVRLAHKPRGLCQIMGAVKLIARLTEIETHAKAGDLEAVITALRDWDTHLDCTVGEMQAFLAEAHPECPISTLV